VYLADDEQTVAQKEGSALRAGGRYVIDIDSDRPVRVRLSDFWFAGDYGGDKLVVSYLEEQDGAN
jgi:hypothetical protein